MPKFVDLKSFPFQNLPSCLIVFSDAGVGVLGFVILISSQASKEGLVEGGGWHCKAMASDYSCSAHSHDMPELLSPMVTPS